MLSFKKVFIGVGQYEMPTFGERENMVAGAQALYNKLDDFMPDSSLRFRVIPEATHVTSFPTTVIQGLNWLFKLEEK